MLHLDLTTEEQQTLVYLLEECISDLRMEIVDTDSVDYKEMLKHRKQVLSKLLQDLQAEPATVPVT